MRTVILQPGDNPITVNKYNISYNFDYAFLFTCAS